ncbi:MAG: outer membrane lipoprotein-sorting protein [Acidobacteria bacterium]|nr:outer membrane lipoprotein-sorting protein [Acidobacteriota bacterium]
MLIAAAPAAAFGQVPSPQLNGVLKQMDVASKNFHNATADFHCDYYERVVRDTTTQQGPVYFLRQGDQMQMGLVVMGPQNKPEKVVQYKDGMLQMFEPSVNQITVLHAGADQAQYSQYFTLGFGGSGSALERAWNVTDLGTEMLPDGSQQVKTDKLDLTSKDPSSKTFTHITIWIDPARALSLRQVFYLANNDKRTCNYNDVKLNGKIDTKKFEIKKNDHTTVVNR